MKGINKMEHKYVPLTEISNNTLDEFEFRTMPPELPDFKLAVTRHENLKRISTDEDLQKSILIGICEVIVGNVMLHKKMPSNRPMVDIPGDFGRSGAFEADFSDPNTVRILNLFGGMK